MSNNNLQNDNENQDNQELEAAKPSVSTLARNVGNTAGKKPSSGTIMALKLMLIVSVMTFALALVNFFTEDIIRQQQVKTINDEMRKIVGDEAVFEEIKLNLSDDEKKYIKQIFRAVDTAGRDSYCFVVKTAGFGGDIDMVVGISNEKVIIGVKVFSNTETPGIGSRVVGEKSEYLPRFINASSRTIQDVEIISGASISSNAVKTGISYVFKASDRLEEQQNAGN